MDTGIWEVNPENATRRTTRFRGLSGSFHEVLLHGGTSAADLEAGRVRERFANADK